MKLKKLAHLIPLLLMGASFNLKAVEISNKDILGDNVPTEYIVAEGDTLWEISETFFKNPWKWTEVWKDNKDIKNPHLIYPGDLIKLVKDKNGKINLEIERVAEDKTVLIITPHKKYEKKIKPIKSIKWNKINQLIKKIKIMKEDDFLSNPRIIATENDNLMINKGEIVYVKGIVDKTPSGYINSIYKLDSAVINDGVYLGNKLRKVGEMELIAIDEDTKISKFTITSQDSVISLNDRLLREVDSSNFLLSLSLPQNNHKIKIIEIIDAIYNGGDYDTVILDGGSVDGLKSGNILTLNKAGKRIYDEDIDDYISLPFKQYGSVIIVDVQENTSLAIVYKSTESVNVNDDVLTPDKEE